jgi:hypothetical protein
MPLPLALPPLQAARDISIHDLVTAPADREAAGGQRHTGPGPEASHVRAGHVQPPAPAGSAWLCAPPLPTHPLLLLALQAQRLRPGLRTGPSPAARRRRRSCTPATQSTAPPRAPPPARVRPEGGGAVEGPQPPQRPQAQPAPPPPGAAAPPLHASPAEHGLPCSPLPFRLAPADPYPHPPPPRSPRGHPSQERHLLSQRGHRRGHHLLPGHAQG